MCVALPELVDYGIDIDMWHSIADLLNRFKKQAS